PFLSQRSLIHPHLPSFPTRRSSDLKRRGRARVRVPLNGGRHLVQRLRGRQPFPEQLAELAVASRQRRHEQITGAGEAQDRFRLADRKSTRLNSSHDQISYAVFCLKK